MWQGSLSGFYVVALRTVSTETVIFRIFLFPEAGKFKYAITKIVTLLVKIELSEFQENLWRSYVMISYDSTIINYIISDLSQVS